MFHKECNSRFSDRLVVVWKNSHILICLPHAVSFDLQFKSDHLIKKVVEIHSLECHSLWDFFQTLDCTFYVSEGLSSMETSACWHAIGMVFFFFCFGGTHVLPTSTSLSRWSIEWCMMGVLRRGTYHHTVRTNPSTDKTMHASSSIEGVVASPCNFASRLQPLSSVITIPRWFTHILLLLLLIYSWLYYV